VNVLVLEPDRVARRLAALLLERLGHPSPTFIEDLNAVPAGDWRLVLASLPIAQLPQLRAALGPQTRIIAMAAQDSAALRQACAQAGIDELLIKPLSGEALAQALAGAAPGAGDFNAAAWKEMRDLLGPVGVSRLIAALVDDLPLQQQRLNAAADAGDLPALRQLAHALRGVALQLGASALAGQWQSAEHAATAGDAAGALGLCRELLHRHAVLVERLRHEAAAT